MQPAPHKKQRVRDRRWRRRGAAALLGVTLALVALEIVMQVVHLVWTADLDARRRADVRAGAETILCVGDSFTFGFGVEPAQAYPQVLGAKLHEVAPGRFVVVNRGYPGRESGEMLRGLAEQLDALRPRLVYLLAGANDRWSLEPEVVDPAASPPAKSGFQLRTLALLERIGTAIFGGGDDARTVVTLPRELCGVWHKGTVELAFEGDGRMRFADVPSRWRVVDGQLRVGAPGAESSLSWQLDDDGTLALEGESLANGRLSLRPGPAAPADFDLAVEAFGDGRFDDARRLVARCEPSVRTLGLTIELDARAGRPDAVERGLAALRARGGHDSDANAELARVLLRIGRIDDGLALATEQLVADPRNRALWQAVTAVPERHPSALEAVRGCIDRVLAEFEGDARATAQLLVLRLHLATRFGGDPKTTLETGLRIGLLQGTFACAVEVLRMNPDAFDEAAIAEVRARLALTEGQARTVDDVLERARTGAHTRAARLERHLLRCAELCRERGAELVLLTYPEPMVLDPAIRRAAAASGARLLDPQPAFAAAMATRARSELFLPDGHCAAAGNALLAEQVFADVMGR